MGEVDCGRLLTDSVPDWEMKYAQLKIARTAPSLLSRFFCFADNVIDRFTHPRSLHSVQDILACMKQLVDEDHLGKRAAVIGCGPEPVTIRDLVQSSYESVGIEAVEECVKRARDYLSGTGTILQGTAERNPLEDDSQSLVLMESVLEHVDSVNKSLSEAYRILKPGGILFISTTNRMRFSLTGINWEFSTRFYNWFPPMVKESYVFTQLHYRPEIANYSPRPAVHWFSFSELCKYGREAGFARFYSPFDLLYLTKRGITSNLSFRLQHWFRQQPWIRAMVVSQMVGDIFMWKRL